jgi:Fe2+ transport system protein FeoA
MTLPWLFRKTAPPLWFTRVAGTSSRSVELPLIQNSLATIANGGQVCVTQLSGKTIQQQLERLGLRVGCCLQILGRTASAVMVQTQERLISLSWEVAESIQVRPVPVEPKEAK